LAEQQATYEATSKAEWQEKYGEPYPEAHEECIRLMAMCRVPVHLEWLDAQPIIERYLLHRRYRHAAAKPRDVASPTIAAASSVAGCNSSNLLSNDGEITIQQLFSLSRIPISTLEKKRNDRPEPISRGRGRGVKNLYSYAAMRDWIRIRFADRALAMPESFAEAAARLREAESVQPAT
jgi:hypothetical protein